MVNEPIPGRTRLFSISVPKAVALIKQTLEFSSSFWPWSPQSLQIQFRNVCRDETSVYLNCLSYFLFLSVCSGDLGAGDDILQL